MTNDGTHGEAAPLRLPWRWLLPSAILFMSFTDQTVVAGDGTDDPSLVTTNTSSAITQTLVQVGDVDKDTLPDVIDLRVGYEGVLYSGRRVGPRGVVRDGGRPGLLVHVTEGYGAQIDLGWRSSAATLDIGQVDTTYAPLRKDLVARIDVRDPVTGWSGYRTFAHFDPVQIAGRGSGQGGGGRFLGFARTEEQEWSEERYQLFGFPGDNSTALLGKTITHWLLDRDHALPERREIWTDRDATWLPGRRNLDPWWHERLVTEWIYEQRGDPVLSVVRPLWPREVTVTEASEHDLFAVVA